MANPMLTINFPAYVPLLKDDSGPIVIGTADQRCMPLLTSKSKFELFLKNFDIQDCAVAELENPQQLVAFLKSYPQRGGKPFDGNVAIDLVDNRPVYVNPIPVTSLIFQFETDS